MTAHEPAEPRTGTTSQKSREREACAAPDASVAEVSFEQARDAYADRKFWVSFFIRPCCPPPPGATAAKQIENQRALVRAREEFTDEQKSELIALIDAGEDWYRRTPYWSRG